MPYAGLWEQIHSWKGMVPKIQIFMWRLISGALMLAQNMHRRMNNFSPMCQRCMQENEFEAHCFFFCPGSRVVWFNSPLGLRTHDLPISIVEAISQCTRYLNEEQIKLFCYTLWELWKARNAVVLQNERFQPEEVNKKALNWMQSDDLAQRPQRERELFQLQQNKYEYRAEDWQVITDGSWDTNERAGCAYLIYQGGELCQIGLSLHTLQEPFHAEARAIKEALLHVQSLCDQNQSHKVTVFSDCQILVQVLNEEDIDNLPSWRAMQDVVETANLLVQIDQGVEIKQVQREAVQQAHGLANEARVEFRERITKECLDSGRKWSSD